MKLILNGFNISNFIFEQMNSSCDIEGFLIGKIIQENEQLLQDYSDQSIQLNTHYDLKYIYYCNDLSLFYDKNIKINPQSLQKLLGERKEHVIGWYKSRKSSSLCISMKERYLHFQLEKFFQTPTPFLFLLHVDFHFQSSSSFSSPSFPSNLFSTDFQFFYYQDDKFQPIECKILNLNDSSQYRRPSYSRLSPSFSLYSDPSCKDCLNNLKTSNKSLLIQIQDMTSELIKSEEELKKEMEERDEIIKNINYIKSQISNQSNSEPIKDKINIKLINLEDDLDLNQSEI